MPGMTPPATAAAAAPAAPATAPTAPPIDPGAMPDVAQAEPVAAERLESEQPAAGAKPLMPEELADRLVPADPRPSPDGRHVVFSAAPPGKKGEHKDQALWLSRDGAPAQPFTAGTANDRDPRWSPDGQQIVFLSDRAERGQDKLYLIPAAGGEARPLGDLQGELSSPAWSPDGAWVAVIRKDPEPPEVKKHKEERDDPIVVDDEPHKLSRLWVVNAASGKARCLTFGPRHVWSFAWAPDGQHLAILTTPTSEINAMFGPSDLALVPAAGGLARVIHTFPNLPADPVFVEGPDGPAIALRHNGFRADPSDSAWLIPQAGGEPRNLLPGYAGVVSAIAPRPGHPSQIGVLMVEGTHGKLYALDVRTSRLEPLTPAGKHGLGSAKGTPAFAADGQRLALIWTDATTPEEVYLGEAGGDGAAVSSFGKDFSGRLCPVEPVRWASSDGLAIEGLLTLPVGYEAGRRYPLIVEIHGGPSWQWEDRVMLDWHDWAQYLASHGYAVLLPNPRGSTGYGSAFQAKLQDDVGGGEAQDVISGVRAMVERGVADPDKLGIAGWSWGGYLTAWIITQTDMFKAAMMGAGLANLISDHGQDDIPHANLELFPGQPYDHMEDYWRASPIRHARNITTPTLILHGDEDARVHPAQGMEYHRALRTLGIPTQFVRYPREGHGINERRHQIDLMRRLLGWFDRYLKGETGAAAVTPPA